MQRRKLRQVVTLRLIFTFLFDLCFPELTESPEIDTPCTGIIDIANFNSIAEELLQAAAGSESDRLTWEEQDADEDLSAPPPNPPNNPALLPNPHDHRKRR